MSKNEIKLNLVNSKLYKTTPAQRKAVIKYQTNLRDNNYDLYRQKCNEYMRRYRNKLKQKKENNL